MVKSYQVAQIDEAACIGCTQCLQVCPVDAILGAPKQMHVVLTEACIGCQLCLPPCPVNCLTLVTTTQMPSAHQPPIKKHLLSRRKHRLSKKAEQKKQADKASTAHIPDLLATAIARSKQKKAPSWNEYE